MHKNGPKFNKSPKAKKMKSPYKTKQGKDAKKKGKMNKIQKNASEIVKTSKTQANDLILEGGEDSSNDHVESDDDTTLETTPVKSILKTSKQSDKGGKEVSFSSMSPDKENLSVKPKKRKLEGDDSKSEESEAKSPKLCEMKKKDRKLLRRKQEKNKVYDLSLKTKKIWEIMRR